LATRLGAVETAQATTNRAGLVPVVPTSITVGSGTSTTGTSGLVTFSGVSSLSLNGCFNSNYRNYRLVGSINSSASNADLRFRLRTAGTDLSATSSYEGSWGQFEYSNANRGQYNSTGTTTSWTIGFVNSGGQGNFTVSADIWNPNTGDFKSMHSTAYGSNSSAGGSAMYNLIHRSFNQGSHDGFSIIPSAGNITGTIQVYGYR
jgi:hypothetical protein